MKIVFMGSGIFAVPMLRALAKVVEIQGVFSQPDRPSGRHLKLTPPPVKEEAEELNLPIFQPETLKTPEIVEQLQRFKPDAIVVGAYGQIIPQNILDIPRLGPINLHASLLPKYRGAAPIHWAIMNGEKQTGVTTFFMEADVDTGAILLQKATRIESDDNVITVESKLAHIGSFLMLETLDLLSEERLRAVKQDDSIATNAPKLHKELGQVDWSRNARQLDCFVRGTHPFPSAYTFINEHRLKIHKAIMVDDASTDAKPGEIVGLTTDVILVQTGRGVIELKEVQPASKARMGAGDFANGYHLEKGMVFDSLKSE